MASSQSRRMGDPSTAARSLRTKESTNLLADDDPQDFTKLSNSFDQLSMKPILAVPPNQKDVKEEICDKKYEV